MSNQEMKNCPSCHGRDMTQGFAFVNRGEQGCTVEPSRACDTCDGVGAITSAQMDHFKIGQAFHEQRVKDGRDSLRDVGNRWGVSPAVVSKAERTGLGDHGIFRQMAQVIMTALPSSSADGGERAP